MFVNSRKKGMTLEFGMPYFLCITLPINLFSTDPLLVRRFPYLLFWRETYPQNFSPEFMPICEYNSWKNTVCCRPFKNGHFVRVCMEKMMDHQHRANGARNIYSNYNHMRAYVERSPNELKKLYLIHIFIQQSRKLWRFWPFLYLNFTRVLQFSSTSPRL